MPIPIVNPSEIYPPAALRSLNAQSGSAVLVAGTVTVTGVNLTANSIIQCTRKVQGGTITSTIGYEAPSASRNTSTGQFVLNAVVAAGTVASSDTSTIDWVIFG